MLRQGSIRLLLLEAELGSDNNGFNRLQVFTPARVMNIQSVSIDDGNGNNQLLVGGEETTIKEGQFSTLFVDDDQFVIGFPTVAPVMMGQIMRL